MKQPWLSLVTITKDDPVGVARTLASAEDLRRVGAQHLVVNGGADGTFRDLPENVRVIHRAPRGVADAFNAGLAEAQGEWVWFLNGGDRVDSRLDPEFLQTLLSGSRADVVIGGITYEGEEAPRPHPPANLQWPPVRSWIPHPSTLVRRRLFDRFGAFDERYSIAMDYEWWLRVLPTGVPVDVLTAPFAMFAPGGLSQQPQLRSIIIREQNDAIRRHRANLSRLWFSSSARLIRSWVVAQCSRRIGKTARWP